MADEIDLVPLDLAALDEDRLLQMFPTPVQASGALLIARGRIAKAPKVLAQLARDVKARKRDLLVAKAYAAQRADGRSLEERKVIASADPEVLSAWEAIDEAELRLEYAREVRKSLSEDVEILRSLNANLRGEASR